MNLTREELLKVPKRHWNEEIHNVCGVYVLPSRRHIGEYTYMDLVAETVDGTRVRFGDVCKSVSFVGTYFRMECLWPSKIIYIWNPVVFYITHERSSIGFVEEE